MIFILFLIGCYPAIDPNCDCEMITDGDERYMTFMLKGCHFCCWYATIEACELTQIDSIGEAFYNHTITDDPVCEWEGVAWSWQYGRVL